MVTGFDGAELVNGNYISVYLEHLLNEYIEGCRALGSESSVEEWETYKVLYMPHPDRLTPPPSIN